MDTHRNLAISAMKAMNIAAADDFMNQAKLPMPEAIAPGALPAMARETVPAETLHLLVDVDMVWTLGDYLPEFDCSAYYDPTSPWYNVIYGAYGLRSYKHDRSAWGFYLDGIPNIAEIVQVSSIDYNFLTAGQFGCPPSQMCYEIRNLVQGAKRGWDFADIVVTIPSGLHDFTTTLGDPGAYVIYGVPPRAFLAKGHKSYEPVRMRGITYLRQMTPPPQPISLAWGALCPDTDAGAKLLHTIIQVMGKHYFEL
jgi:hypothetical protein